MTMSINANKMFSTSVKLFNRSQIKLYKATKLWFQWITVIPFVLSGYHADTPITIKAEPSIWPTAAFINIHEHPI